MKNKLTRALFPFYLEDHRFLKEKWWFRLLIVLYICIVPTILVGAGFFAFSDYMDSYLACYTVVGETYNWGFESRVNFEREYAICRDNVVNALAPAGVYAIGIAIASLSLLYLAQFIFFKVLIDFVVLGAKVQKY